MWACVCAGMRVHVCVVHCYSLCFTFSPFLVHFFVWCSFGYKWFLLLLGGGGTLCFFLPSQVVPALYVEKTIFSPLNYISNVHSQKSVVHNEWFFSKFGLWEDLTQKVYTKAPVWGSSFFIMAQILDFIIPGFQT